MATHNVTLGVGYDFESDTLYASFTGTTNINKGDTVNFTVSNLQGFLPSLLIFGWRSDIWVDPSDISLTGDIYGQSFSKVARVNAAEDINHLSIRTTINSTIREAIITPHIGIIAPQDTTPNPFSLGPDITELQPASSFSLPPITITGITAGTSISILSTGGGSASFSIEGTPFTASGTVFNNQTVQVIGTAASNFGTNTTITLTAGGVSDTVIVGTTNNPPPSSIISMSVGSSLGLNQIKDFFAGGSNLSWNQAPNNIRAYYRGGTYVPNIAQNAGIPTSGQISVNNFRSSHTSLFFTVLPSGFYKQTSTLNGTTSLTHSWAIGNGDFDVGFGPGMKGAAQFSYAVIQDSGSGESTGVTLEVAFGQPGTPRQGNTYVIMRTPNVTGNTEATYRGTLIITATYGGASVSASCRYHFSLWGP